MKERLKIAIFSGNIPSTSFIERLIDGVSKHHEVLLFGMQKQKVDYSSNSIRIFSTPNSKLKNSFITLWRATKLFFTNPKALFQLLEEVKKEASNYSKFMKLSKCIPILLHKPDILHLQWAKDLPKYAFLKSTFKIPIVVSFRGAHINYTPIVEPDFAEKYKATFPLVDAFHGVSKTIIDKASQYGDIANRSTVIYSPLPQFFFEAYEEFQKKESEIIRIVSVGRNHWKKGYQYAVDAIKQLKEKGYNVHYTLIGPSSPTEALLFQIHQLSVEDSISFVGQLNQEDLLKALKKQDILLLPSLGEGIANVALEAMSMGLPVISTNCGGMAEVVKHKETGWLIPMRNTDAIAEAVIDFNSTSESELKSITNNAYKFVKNEFDFKNNISKFISLYNTVVKS
ncbi:glycosyltransferase family 4 protein [Winogradskyella jejuensis]|uniref:Colanic acid/amylovoran biosynthesis glycosyltransferase n=1 Tax=Winogradskyella jejuensis TaxID=1089305 RepID=A0A1M5SKN1_9FLAO|nr:glycosyltransferase family 4 protein [Winogradskyella jejuensis]SHH39059.1 colanic acid/amylovoran biosynthesis glycosyltransferase [Winogradskyella jejuensis]